MMTTDSLFQLLNIAFFLKIFTLVGLGLYVGFALVMLRQVSLMKQTIRLGLEWLISAIATIHLILALVLFVLAIVFL